ncbi:hypothetical protein B5V88_16250, partial [Heyndrickxia sporothermodurans]
STVLLRDNYSREILDGWQVFFLYKNKVQRYVLLLFITLHFYFAIHNYTKAELTLNLKNSDFSEEDKDTFENIDQEYMDTQVNKMKYIDSKQEIN